MSELAARLLGRGQRLIKPAAKLPLVVACYPRGREWFASELNSALSTTFGSTPKSLRGSYAEVFARIPSLVVADLRGRNVCSCLGHHHPGCTHSRLARRLSADMGEPIGEIDLAVEAIRGWEPLPLSGLAAAESVAAEQAEARSWLRDARFRLALLAVFLHELEHLAFPGRQESEIRRRSDFFYVSAVKSFMSEEFGLAFGI